MDSPLQNCAPLFPWKDAKRDQTAVPRKQLDTSHSTWHWGPHICDSNCSHFWLLDIRNQPTSSLLGGSRIPCLSQVLADADLRESHWGSECCIALAPNQTRPDDMRHGLSSYASATLHLFMRLIWIYF